MSVCLCSINLTNQSRRHRYQYSKMAIPVSERSCRKVNVQAVPSIFSVIVDLRMC